MNVAEKAIARSWVGDGNDKTAWRFAYVKRKTA